MPAQPPAVEQVATQTIKCLLYRDQLQDQWQTVLQAPVKYIIGMADFLQVCKVTECLLCEVAPDSPEVGYPDSRCLAERFSLRALPKNQANGRPNIHSGHASDR